MVAVPIQTILGRFGVFARIWPSDKESRRPARVKVSSFDVRIVLWSRERSGERLNSYKFHYHASDFRIFDFPFGQFRVFSNNRAHLSRIHSNHPGILFERRVDIIRCLILIDFEESWVDGDIFRGISVGE